MVGGEGTWYILMGTGWNKNINMWNLEQLKTLLDFVEDISKTLNINSHDQLFFFQSRKREGPAHVMEW